MNLTESQWDSLKKEFQYQKNGNSPLTADEIAEGEKAIENKDVRYFVWLCDGLNWRELFNFDPRTGKPWPKDGASTVSLAQYDEAISRQ